MICLPVKLARLDLYIKQFGLKVSEFLNFFETLYIRIISLIPS